MYVCMHVRTYVCMYVRMYVCMCMCMCVTKWRGKTIFHTQICHTQLCHTPSFTYLFDTHHLSHTTLSHTIFQLHLSHTSLSHLFVTHHISHTHTFLSHTNVEKMHAAVPGSTCGSVHVKKHHAFGPLLDALLSFCVADR